LSELAGIPDSAVFPGTGPRSHERHIPDRYETENTCWVRDGDQIIKITYDSKGNETSRRPVRPDDEQARYRGWKVWLAARLVACPTCQVDAAEPCRTLDTSREHRITAIHTDRYRVASRTPGPDLAEVCRQVLSEIDQVKNLPVSSLPAGAPWRDTYGVYDEAGRYRIWKVLLLEDLVACPSCGAPPAEPCRTGKGRIPGRITTSHQPRRELITGPPLRRRRH
jgi:hypothetical protein